MIIAGDIGGTHTRLGLFERGKLLQEGRFLSREFSGLVPIVRQFLGTSASSSFSCAVFGIPGPVRGRQVQTTNLPWLVDAAEMSRAFSIPKVSLLNDLEASGWGIEALSPDDLVCLHKGAEAIGNRVLVSAGTGLGEAGLYWDGRKYHPFASEGGHADFAPRTPLEVELWTALRLTHGHVSWERVLSGSGLYALYQFLVDTGRASPSPELREQLKVADPAAVISEWSVRDTGCAQAVQWWASLYGSEAGNMALKFLATGGVYLGGGMAPRHIDVLKQHLFSAFQDKGRFNNWLKTVPIWVIRNDNVALLGAARYAMRDQ